MSELKPCPFCGGEAYFESEACMDDFGSFHYVKCRSCGASSGKHFASHGNDCPQFYAEVRDDWQGRVESQENQVLKQQVADLVSAFERLDSYDLADADPAYDDMLELVSEIKESER